MSNSVPVIPTLATTPVTLIDVLHEKQTLVNVLDFGYVQLVDVMPRLVDSATPTMDASIANAARISYGKGTRSINDDRTLIRYMQRHKHKSPFEVPKFQFVVRATLDVIAQMRRHRTMTFVNWNQESLRYSEACDEFYIPEPLRPQSTTNKQGSGDGTIDTVVNQKFRDLLRARKPYQEYEAALAANVSREQARLILPTNLYSTFVCTIDLSNLQNFLLLRMDSHAQFEIRQYANAMYELINPLVPEAISAWSDYELNSITFTVPELRYMMASADEDFYRGINHVLTYAGCEYNEKDPDDEYAQFRIKNGLANKREFSELQEKCKRILKDYTE